MGPRAAPSTLLGPRAPPRRQTTPPGTPGLPGPTLSSSPSRRCLPRPPTPTPCAAAWHAQTVARRLDASARTECPTADAAPSRQHQRPALSAAFPSPPPRPSPRRTNSPAPTPTSLLGGQWHPPVALRPPGEEGTGGARPHASPTATGTRCPLDGHPFPDPGALPALSSGQSLAP